MSSGVSENESVGTDFFRIRIGKCILIIEDRDSRFDERIIIRIVDIERIRETRLDTLTFCILECESELHGRSARGIDRRDSCAIKCWRH